MMFRTAQLILRETNRVLGRTTTSPAFFSRFSTAASSSQKLAGKVAVITGGASGIGKATAKEFIENGAKVIMADVQDDLGHSAAAELGPDASYTRCDVSDETQVAAAVDLAVKRHGHLDILYNNAGVMGTMPQDDMASVDLANFDRIMAINARAALVGIKHAARVMSPRRSGVILCTASDTGIMPIPNIALYAVSKATTIAIVRAAAEPLSRHGLRVNAISPHGTRTAMMMHVVSQMYPGVSKDDLEKMADTAMDAGAVMEPEYVARAALYLASDEAKYVNGHNLVRLAGKVAVITGAASGIGKATAAEFIRNGAKVIITDVNDDLGHAAAAELGPDATYARCDVADEAQVAAAVDLAVARHGRLDVMHNNAAVPGRFPQDDMASVDLADFDAMMAVNARASLAGIKHAARVMAPRRAGVILCTASAVGVLPLPAVATHSITKATIIAIVRAAAEPLARHGLRVNAISPGAVRTPVLQGKVSVMSASSPTMSDELKQMIDVDANDMMMGPEEVAMAAVYLASDEARYVTGHNLVVDGGYTVHKGADTPADVQISSSSKTKRVFGTSTWTAGLVVNGFSTASSSHQRLAGKVAVITGGASGIGKATATEFIKNGAKVIIADIQDDLGHSVAAELGPDAAYTHCDVADEAQVAAAVGLAVARHGRLDVFHNNAGIAGALPQDDMAAVDLGDFDRVMAVNARSTLAAVKHAARAMAPRCSGCVLCTSSGAGVIPVPAVPVYSVSKATVIAIVRAAAEPMARHGLRVNAISPGATRTPLLLRQIPLLSEMSPSLSDGLKTTVEKEVGEGGAVVLLAPEDIARAAVYLASDEARYVNGHNLVVDAGYTVHKGA
uniref:Ketoreductase domain-containing protein n=1 Tax=Oryza meridionalis TaxID=40149 RepID=A0A0E0EFN6_9ORYZ